ncbi:MAG TPA: DegT/DnrJ/EryC1/StrS family aminotransferase [Candidatus Paceibacterota bacterium]|nr:DegT/DnrJ/EryC1/StrS family aminotransferase [Verrucomicrobiota bacterium]HSA11340.1 DegT/DnrJ/EryC1/StrS family aminotransferase [Candidatus Paceibacterota bacterium]
MTLTRRSFIRTAAAGSVALGWLGTGQAPRVFAAEAAKPALLGGTPAHKGGWVAWPQWRKEWEPEMLEVYRSCRWFRNSAGHVAEFEQGYAKLLGAKRCLATTSGTTALIVSLYAMDVDAGDEVIVSPYTFIASYNAILSHKALPVFADTDPATLTVDPAMIESRITDRTRAIMPVHIFGMPCDMDPINAIARKHKLAVVEDACQAWLAEYKGRKCGTLGDLGCFSFQESKHLPSGEGGAITSMSEELIDKCDSYHNCGRAVGTNKGNGCFTRGNNYRMTQAQAVLLRNQLEKLVQETEVRRANADYLSANLGKIPGITPVRLSENSRPVWHLYSFRYDPAQFNGLSREQFAKAMGAEGVPCGGVYHEQYYDGLLDEAIASRGFKRLWGTKRLKAYRDSFQELKGNKQVCETTVSFSQTMLLTDRSAMDDILEAIRKVQAHSAALVKA